MLSRSPPHRGGFTLVEVVVALVILSTAVLGLAATSSRLATSATNAELRALALEAVQDRVAEVRLDPRYTALDSLYDGTESEILGASRPGYDRTTTVTRLQVTNPSPMDYTRIVVEVTGPLLNEPIQRQIVVAAP
jgi:prepilin-type N-terminal cleavage/methylation domain-containing protein